MKQHISRTHTTQRRFPLGKLPKEELKRPPGWGLSSVQRKTIKKVAKKRDRAYQYKEEA